MDDGAVKHGPLLTPPQGKLLKRAWQKKYYVLYKASNYAVERVEVFDNEDCYVMNTPHKIIPLNECIKVVQSPQKNQQNVFEVITKGQAFQFSTETTQELAEWLLAFQSVAFGGGQRREAISSSAPSPHLNRSLPCSSLRTSVISNTEEENQIYCSFGDPESYTVHALETPASAACGIHGDYLLVVCPSQLLLMAPGTAEATVAACQGDGSRGYLFAWPYRHIRRYGRSSSTFTFEAGRKCASGAGTFSFSTPRGNDIFLSVQANTRNLKREVDGSTPHATTSLHCALGSRTALSWPPMEDGLPPPPLPSSPPQHQRHPSGISAPPSVTTKSGSTATAAKESPPSILDRVLSRTKAIPPFAKPPRRSKMGSPTVSEPTTPSSPEPTFRLEISSAARAKLAAEVSAAVTAAAAANFSATPLSAPRRLRAAEELEEPTYAVPEVRNDAWKTFGMDGENFHQERTPVDEEEEFYSCVSVEGGPSSLDAVVPVAQPWPAKTVLPSLATIAAADGYNYDHLSLFGGHQPASPPSSASPPGASSNGHIYSRLTAPTSTPASTSPTPSVCHFRDQTTRPPLEPQTNFSVSLDSSSGVGGDSEPCSVSSASSAAGNEDIKRFLQNEDVYTVVKKPLKKLNLSSIEV